jgi:hypothetical protein
MARRDPRWLGDGCPPTIHPFVSQWFGVKASVRFKPGIWRRDHNGGEFAVSKHRGQGRLRARSDAPETGDPSSAARHPA